MRHAARRAVGDRPRVGLFREALDHADEALVLRRPGRGELEPIVVAKVGSGRPSVSSTFIVAIPDTRRSGMRRNGASKL
jgi:hypothetical protein